MTWIPFKTTLGAAPNISVVVLGIRKPCLPYMLICLFISKSANSLVYHDEFTKEIINKRSTVRAAFVSHNKIIQYIYAHIHVQVIFFIHLYRIRFRTFCYSLYSGRRDADCPPVIAIMKWDPITCYLCRQSNFGDAVNVCYFAFCTLIDSLAHLFVHLFI